MKSYLLVVFLIFLACSCREKKQHNSPLPVLDSIRLDTANAYIETGDKKTVTAYYLAYDSSEGLMDNLRKGWMDTFSIDDQHFRLRTDTTATDLNNFCIDQVKKDKWEKLFNFYLSSDEYTKNDIDTDGYTDFIKYYHEKDYIYFYNPLTKTLSDSVYVMSGNTTLINKKNLVIYNHYDAMYGNMYESSQLYTYRNRKAFFFYELLVITDDSTEIKKINLYKYKNGNYNDTVFVKTIAVRKNIDFEYSSFWKKNYEKLIGYK